MSAPYNIDSPPPSYSEASAPPPGNFDQAKTQQGPPPPGYAPYPSGYPAPGTYCPPPGPVQPAPGPGYAPPGPGYAPPGPGYAPPGPGYPAGGAYPPPPPAHTTMVLTSGMRFGESSVAVQCPHCQAQVMTSLNYTSGTLAWLICLGLCFVGLWIGCCLIPFCLPACQDVLHSCPNCQRQIGRYNRI